MLLPVRAAYGSVVLRRFRTADAQRVAELCNEPDVAMMTDAIPHPYTVEMAAEWIAGQEDATSEEHVFAVLRRANDTLIGAVGITPAETAQDMLGYWIGQPYWGHGYATDAAAAALAFAFTLLNVEELHTSHLERNPASGRVLEKCGLREVRREMRPHRGGALEPVRIWAIDRPAWRAWTNR